MTFVGGMRHSGVVVVVGIFIKSKIFDIYGNEKAQQNNVGLLGSI